MTIKNKILPVLALLGLAVAVTVAVRQQRTTPPAQPVAAPARAPFTAYIGGSGMIEASSENIAVGASSPGVVQEVAVAVGQKVRSGDVLFRIDDRDARAAVVLKEASLVKARASLAESEANWRDYRTQYERMRGVTDLRAVSLDDLEKRRNAELVAQAQVKGAQADVAVAQAELAAAKTALDLLTVRTPLDAEVLQVNIRPGEYAAAGVLDTPLLRLGSMEVLHVRVDIDENDAWRFRPGARAVAYLRGNRDLGAELSFVRVEPYVKPKTSLSGSSTEQVDTRVLQVIYSFRREDLAAYVGQQVDAFIEAEPVRSSAAAAGASQ
jgi:RND family efflux transporter MFP subunit